MYLLTTPREKAKPHVLFANLKYMAGDPKLGECAWETLIHSFAANGVGTYDVFFYDAARIDGEDPDWKILELCRVNSYDAVILYWYPASGTRNINLSPDTLYLIRTILGVRIASIFYDTWSRDFYLQTEALAPLLDVAVITDSLSHFVNSKQQHKYITLCFAPDITLFNDPGMKRDIPVSLNGTSNIYRDKILVTLREKNVSCLSVGGYDNYLPIREYAEIYKRSKISINTSWTPMGKRTFKARVMEATLCGSMLLEQENEETARRFNEYEEFVPFSDENDLAEKISYYLEHEEERYTIAENGKKRAQELAAPEMFWGKLLETATNTSTYNADDAYKAIGNLKALLMNGIGTHPLMQSLHLLEGKQVAVWGTGGCYHNNIAWWLHSMQDRFNFVGFVDSNPDLWDTDIDGYPVFCPSEINEKGIDSIILATHAGHDIVNEYANEYDVEFYM